MGGGPRRRWRRRGWILLATVGLLLAALSLLRCSRDIVPAPPRPFFSAPGPLVIAHRGASGREREHTLAAYDAALADGADVLELDLRRSRDGALVISHDASLERLYGSPLRIADATLGELRGAVAAAVREDPAAHLPTLGEIFARYPRVRLNLELKTESGALADALARAIRAAGREDTVLVASFHDSALSRFRRASRGQVATSASSREVARFLFCYLLSVPSHPSYDALQLPAAIPLGPTTVELGRASLIDFAHRHALQVHFWTIDDAAEMRRLLSAGADGIMTNVPGADAAAERGLPMKRSALLALGCLAAASCSRGERATPDTGAETESAREPADDGRPAIVFLGDSLTAGYGLAASEAMPALVQEKVAAAGLPYNVINAGRSGDTSAGGLARLSWYLREPLNLQVLAINLGSNDAMRGLPLAELEKNLLGIVRQTRAARPGAQIFLFQMETFPNLGADYAEAYRELFPRVARTAEVDLLPFPLDGVAGVPELNQGDGIHPTARGAERMAENVWEALAPKLWPEPPAPASPPAGGGSAL